MSQNTEKTPAQAESQISRTCKTCDYGLTPLEAAQPNCPSCGNPMQVRQNVAITVAALPGLFGDTM